MKRGFMKLIKIKQFRETYFDKGNAPSKDTIIRQIGCGELSGRRIGNCYYIDIDEFELEYIESKLLQ